MRDLRFQGAVTLFGIVIIFFISLYALRYIVKEGFVDTPKKTPKEANIDNLIKYAKDLITLGMIVDPSTPGGTAIKIAIANMSSGKIDISDSNSTSILIQTRAELFDPIKAENVFNSLSPPIPPNQYVLQNMSVADIRTFLYKMKDAMAESNDAMKAYSAINTIKYKSDDPIQQGLEAATAVYCVIPSILSSIIKKAIGNPVCKK